MSNVANQLFIKINEVHERMFDCPIPRGVYVCIREDGKLAIDANNLKCNLPFKYLLASLGGVPSATSQQIKNDCTGNFVRG